VNALETRGLTVRFGTGRHGVVAVDEVDLQVPAGQVLGLVGESGSGKSTLARAVVGLVQPSAGRVLMRGEDVDRLPAARRRAARRRVQMVFQDPYASLNPRMAVGEALAEAIRGHRRLGRPDRAREVARLLDLVGLDERRAHLLPRELSGGQRQRVAIARALATEPDVLIADEITSALDVSVQGAVLNLVREIQARLGLSMLFISHNLALVRYVSDVVAVMYLGRVVETAPVEELVSQPRHPYTRSLLDAVPVLGDARREDSPELDGDPADPYAPPPGCHFHPRCPVGPLVLPDRAVCATDDPHAGAPARPHGAACHFVGS
jgi:peptide/nickel transport system ATP-binding protein